MTKTKLDADHIDPGMDFAQSSSTDLERERALEKHKAHLPDVYGLKKGAETFPLMILPQVANVCNSRCSHCWFNADQDLRKRDGQPWMDPALMRKIIDEVAERADPKPLIRITGTGEPFLWKSMTDILVYGAGEKKVRMAVITNGSMVTPERSKRVVDAGVEAIEFSVDAADKETYEQKARPGLNWDVMHRNLDAMIEHRNKVNGKTKVFVSVVVNTSIIDPVQVEDYWRTRVDNVIMRKYLTYGTNSKDLYSEETYLPPDQRVPCPYPFERMVITANGNVTFCNFDVRDSLYVGNVNETKIEELWKNSIYQSWRDKILTGNYEEIPLCKKCDDWKYKSWNHNFFKVLKDADEKKKPPTE